MKKILVLQHVDYEILGTLYPMLKEKGFNVDCINFGKNPEAQPKLNGASALILLGGPMNVNQTKQYPFLAYETELIKEAIALDIPVLGICLGSQLIAKALGGKVQKHTQHEIGWYKMEISENGKKDPLLKHIDHEYIFEWHGDTFSLPSACTLLASTQTCSHQAIRYGDKVYGFQFHLEVDVPTIQRWMNIPRYQEDLLSLWGKNGLEKVETETEKNIHRSMELSKLVFEAFLHLI